MAVPRSTALLRLWVTHSTGRAIAAIGQPRRIEGCKSPKPLLKSGRRRNSGVRGLRRSGSCPQLSRPIPREGARSPNGRSSRSPVAGVSFSFYGRGGLASAIRLCVSAHPIRSGTSTGTWTPLSDKGAGGRLLTIVRQDQSGRCVRDEPGILVSRREVARALHVLFGAFEIGWLLLDDSLLAD
jgi:hypothetical protein